MSALYIHIPFCSQKCHYCSFFSTVSLKNKSEIVNSIIVELDQKQNYLDSKKLNTIYFGGGTPSILSKDELSSIFNKINQIYTFSEDCEITFEANPDDINRDSLSLYKSLGINRLSIGIQSFNDKILKSLNRAHSAKDAINSVKLAIEFNFGNLNIDLIYGIPSLSVEQWKRELDIFLNFNIPHLSAYALTVEPKTALNYLIKKQKYPPINEEVSNQQFNYLINFLKENNFYQYEISNFAKQGMESKHNTNYWRNLPYLGIGPSANSFNGYSRQWNYYSISKYIESVKNNTDYEEKEDLSKNDRFNEYIMLGLRTSYGISFKYILDNYGNIYKNHLEEYINYNSDKFIFDDERIKLNSKSILFADRIASDIFL